jgi:hypothetical protein
VGNRFVQFTEGVFQRPFTQERVPTQTGSSQQSFNPALHGLDEVNELVGALKQRDRQVVSGRGREPRALSSSFVFQRGQ